MRLQPVINAILAQYKLEPDGLHGIPHWERVRENGLRLAEVTRAGSAMAQPFVLQLSSLR